MLSKKIALYCTNFIYILLVLIPFVASFSSAVVTVFAIWAIVAFIFKRAVQRDFHFTKTPIQAPFSLLIFLSFLSFFNTVNLRASMEGMWKLFYFGFLFTVITEELTDKRHAGLIINAMLLGLFLASIDGIWQLHSGFDFFRHHPYNYQGGYVKDGLGFPRIRAAFPHTNLFAAYLGLFIPLALVQFIASWKQGMRRTFYLIIFILGIFCLFWTFSQGAIAGFIIALLLIGILKKNKLIFLFLICAVVIAPLVLPAGIKDYMKDSTSVWQVILNRERIGNYKSALNIIKHNPLLGIGVNTYALNIEKYMVIDNSRFVGNKGYADNIYLHIAAEIGIFGLFALLWLIFALFSQALKTFRATRNEELKIYILGLTAGLAGFLINSCTESLLYNPKVAVLFWFSVGVLSGTIKLSRRDEKKLSF